MDFIFINFLQYVWKVEKHNFDENGFLTMDFIFINFLQCVWKVELCCLQ